MWIVIATAIGVFCGNKFLCNAAYVAPARVAPPWPEGHRWWRLWSDGTKVVRPRWVGAAPALACVKKNEAVHYESNNQLSMSQITSYLFSNSSRLRSRPPSDPNNINLKGQIQRVFQLRQRRLSRQGIFIFSADIIEKTTSNLRRGFPPIHSLVSPVLIHVVR
jgi:hypothetical protein